MAILVDPIQRHEAPGLSFKQWSHLVSTVDEADLHAFAKRIGLRRSWAQLRPNASAAHYDITPAKRVIALQIGAIEVPGRLLVQLNYDGMTRRGIRGEAAKKAADLEAATYDSRTAHPPQGSLWPR